MKVSALREMKVDMLKQELLALLKEQFNLRLQKSAKQLTRTHQMKQVRRHIAQVLMIIHEKEGVV